MHALTLARQRIRERIQSPATPQPGNRGTGQGRPGWLLRGSSGRQTLVVQLTAETCLVIDAPAWADPPKD